MAGKSDQQYSEQEAQRRFLAAHKAANELPQPLQSMGPASAQSETKETDRSG